MPPDLSKNNNFFLKLPLDGLFLLVLIDNLNRRLKLKGDLEGRLPFLPKEM